MLSMTKIRCNNIYGPWDWPVWYYGDVTLTSQFDMQVRLEISLWPPTAQVGTHDSAVQNQTFFIFEIRIHFHLQAKYTCNNKHLDTQNNKIDREEKEYAWAVSLIKVYKIWYFAIFIIHKFEDRKWYIHLPTNPLDDVDCCSVIMEYIFQYYDY